MKKFLKDFYPYIIFVVSQAIFLFLDYFYVSAGENFQIYFNIFIMAIVMTFLALTVRICLEVLILRVTSFIAKKQITFRTIVKILFKSMIIPSLICIIFILVQIIFIGGSAEMYQVITSTFTNCIYMFFVIMNFKKIKYNVNSYVMSIYAIAYTIYQVYNIIKII